MSIHRQADAKSIIKVCEEGETNFLHFLEDKAVVMSGSHDQFSVVNVDGRRNILSDLLAVKYGKLLFGLLFSCYVGLISASMDTLWIRRERAVICPSLSLPIRRPVTHS